MEAGSLSVKLAFRTGAPVLMIFVVTVCLLSGCVSSKAGDSPTESARSASAVQNTSSEPTSSSGESTSSSQGPTAETSTSTPTQASESVPTFGPDSIKIVSQKTTASNDVKVEVLKVVAPADTRFAIGTGETSADAIDCEAKVLNDKEVLYEVRCRQQGPGQELFSTITYGDFDCGFKKKLK